ncbi:cell division protein FtsZ [Candidatus Dependentiae bacterium]|nr:cell division protein FtsZ [Candidatus Dependentiae bacterium]
MIKDFAKIVVIGVGGGGCNALSHMVKSQTEGIEYIAVNTDLQQLKRLKNCQTLQIGEKLTNGLGAGGIPEIGRKSAIESRDKITALVSGADIVIITACLGGGTGTGAAPEIAAISKSLGILTIPVVTIPFKFEGKKRRLQADEGLKKISENTDSIIIISNERLLENTDQNVGLYEAFAMADDVAKDAVLAITTLIVQTGVINVDLEDIKSILKNAGCAMIGIGFGIGEHRAIDAAKQSITSPLLEVSSIKGASRMLVNIAGGEELTLYEVEKAATYITNEADNDAIIIFGTTIIPDLKDKIKITTLIAGLKNQSENIG